MLKIPDRYKRNVYIFAALAFDETRFERKLYLQKLRCSEFQDLIHCTIKKLGNLNRERIADHFKVKFVFEDDSGIIEIGQGHTIYIKLKKRLKFILIQLDFITFLMVLITTENL